MSDAFGIDVLAGLDGEVCLVARGEFDIAAAATFRAAVEAHGGGSGRVVLDLRDIAFMDSTALYALVAIHHRLGDRLIVVPSDAALRLLRLSGLDSVLPLATPA